MDNTSTNDKTPLPTSIVTTVDDDWLAARWGRSLVSDEAKRCGIVVFPTYYSVYRSALSERTEDYSIDINIGICNPPTIEIKWYCHEAGGCYEADEVYLDGIEMLDAKSMAEAIYAWALSFKTYGGFRRAVSMDMIVDVISDADARACSQEETKCHG